MASTVSLKKELKCSTFDTNRCIICQKPGELHLTSQERGRTNVMQAAFARKDVVFERLQNPDVDQHFKYHMTNKCYKSYTMKKTIKVIASSSSAQVNTVADNEENAKPVDPLPAKRTRSSIGAREAPSQKLAGNKLKCFICDKVKSKGIF